MPRPRIAVTNELYWTMLKLAYYDASLSSLDSIQKWLRTEWSAHYLHRPGRKDWIVFDDSKRAVEFVLRYA